MKIMYICAYSPDVTGGVRSVVSQYLYYMSQVATVYVYSYSNLNFESGEGCYCQVRTEKALRETLGQIDIVVFHEVYYINYYRLAKILTKKNIPYIVIPHCSLTDGAQRQKRLIKCIVNKIWVNKFIMQAHRIQYLSEYERESSKAFRAESIIIPNGIPQADVGVKDYEEHNSVEFTFIGRFNIQQKGLDMLLDACALIRDEMAERNININIYGTDFEGGKKYLQSRIRAYGLENNVWLRNPVYGDKKCKALLESDIYILTSRFEGLPMGILEAMQMGLPILVTPGSGFGEVVKREECGWCAEFDKDSIAQVILSASEEKAKWALMSHNAIRVIRDCYAWERIAAITKEKYENLGCFIS